MDNPTHKTKNWIAGSVIFLGVIFGLGIISISLAWSSFVSFAITSDLSEYYTTINQPNFKSESKQELLTEIDRVRDKARNKSIGFWKWLSYDESISLILKDHQISPHEFESLKLELDRLEKDLETGSP